MSEDIEKIISQAVTQILTALGEDTNRAGLKDTPKRVARSLMELNSGHGLDPSEMVKDAIYPTDATGMVLQKDLEFYSLCEHHLLPFSGKVHLAYIPNEKIIGLSKISRVIDIFARRLQVQENLTRQIALAIDQVLKPKGVAVFIEASHYCMMMRGVRKPAGFTSTSEYLGDFASNSLLRSDFLLAIKN